MDESGLENSSTSDLEGGISLLRRGDEATQLRLRLERPARIGQFLMGGLGAVTAAAGVTAWITHALAVGLAFGIFGTVLIVLAVIQHLLLRRDLLHSPDQAVLREGGVELFLRNGEVRGLSWTDADMALNIISRKAPPPANREYLLVWMPDLKIPSMELSADGYGRLKHAAEAQQLIVSERRRGRGEAATLWTEIRQGGPRSENVSTRSAKIPTREE